jgi:hypothetical protein
LAITSTSYVPRLPKLGDTSATYPQSQWPTMSARATVRNQMCIKALTSDGRNYLWSAAAMQQRTSAQWSALMDTQYLNFAPRLGISYSPDSKTVIRTGYGIFYTPGYWQRVLRHGAQHRRARDGKQRDTTAPYGNSNLTWANAAPGASGGTIVNLGPSTTSTRTRRATRPVTPSSSCSTSSGRLDRLVVRGGIPGRAEPASLWVHQCKSTDSIRIPRHRRSQLQSRRGSPFMCGYQHGTTPAQYGIQYQHDQGTGNYNAFSVKATRRFSKGSA